MQERTHIAIAEEVLRASGLAVSYAEYAATPDEIQSVDVGPLGTTWNGLNLEGLKHFCRPVYVRGKLVSMHGYCWHDDKSIKIELPNVPVKSIEDAWPSWLRVVAQEPLAWLIDDLSRPGHKGTTAADEITFPSAATEADWFAKFILAAAAPAAGSTAGGPGKFSSGLGWSVVVDGKDRTLMALLYALHHVHDSCVMHHARGMLLGGHAEHEGALHETWFKMFASGAVKRYLERHRTVPIWDPRQACTENAQLAYRGFSTKGGCIERALLSSLSVCAWYRKTVGI